MNIGYLVMLRELGAARVDRLGMIQASFSFFAALVRIVQAGNTWVVVNVAWSRGMIRV